MHLNYLSFNNNYITLIYTDIFPISIWNTLNIKYFIFITVWNKYLFLYYILYYIYFYYMYSLFC